MANLARTLRVWLLLAVLHLGLAQVLLLVEVPSAYLFAGVVTGLLAANLLTDPPHFPPRLRTVGLAALGMSAGVRVDQDVLHAVAEQPAVILGGVVVTLALTLLAGQVLRLSPHVDAPTAIMSSIAGGAASVTAIARELGAAEAVVMSIQYLRVLFVLATVPLVAAWAGVGEKRAPVTVDAWNTDTLALIGVALVVGLALARLLRFGGAQLILPLLVAAAMSVSGQFPDASIPTPVVDFGYSVAGLSVGFALTAVALRGLVPVMPLALLQVILTVGGCAVVGVILSELIGISAFDGYLATTPGGLPLVTAVAIGSGGAVGLILTMQVMRLALALALAPVLAAAVRHRSDGSDDGTPDQ